MEKMDIFNHEEESIIVPRILSSVHHQIDIYLAHQEKNPNKFVAPVLEKSNFNEPPNSFFSTDFSDKIELLQDNTPDSSVMSENASFIAYSSSRSLPSLKRRAITIVIIMSLIFMLLLLLNYFEFFIVD